MNAPIPSIRTLVNDATVRTNCAPPCSTTGLSGTNPNNTPTTSRTRMKIRYVDAPAGAGKTYGLSAQIGQRVHNGEKIILTQPTKDLIEKTVPTLRELNPTLHIEVIHRGRV